MLEPVTVTSFACPLCPFTSDERERVVAHLQEMASAGKLEGSAHLPVGTLIRVGNRHGGGYSMAKVAGVAVLDECHEFIYPIDRTVYFKDSDHWGDREPGRWVMECEIVTPSDIEDRGLVFAQAGPDGVDDILRELNSTRSSVLSCGR